MTSIDVGIDVRPVAGRIGAEVDGVTLAGDLDSHTFSAINRALLEHKVLFFRGQHDLDAESQEAFARLFGEPVAHPTVPSADGRFSLAIDSEHGARADQWHSDVTFVPNYPKVSILRAEVVPSKGGDTLWSNAAAAYEDLGPSLQALADGLRAVHTNDYDYAVPRQSPHAERLREYRVQFVSTTYETEHPVVRVHPETGERTLLLGNFVREILGVSRRDSRALLDLFQGHVEREENIVRWRWAPGDVAIWDNRATQHRAVADYGEQPRKLFRVTVDGDVPVGVDGRASELLSATERDGAAR
jgi:alkyl sulfatase